jgi:transposase
MYLRLANHQGTILVNRNIPCEPSAFLDAVKAYKHDLVVTAECVFCWYWLADLCAQHGITFVLAHALYLKAIHGAKAKNDAIDADKLLVLLRGGAIPMAYVYPPAMRATRDLLRRRLYFTRKRAELFSHIQNTFHQYNLIKPSGELHSPKHRAELASCFADPVVRATIEADLQLCSTYDTLIKNLEKKIQQQARLDEPMWARSWRSRFSMRSTRSSASPVCRTSAPTAAWSSPNTIQLVSGLAVAVPRSATRISSGRSPKLPSASCTETHAA